MNLVIWADELLRRHLLLKIDFGIEHVPDVGAVRLHVVRMCLHPSCLAVSVNVVRTLLEIGPNAMLIPHW